MDEVRAIGNTLIGELRRGKTREQVRELIDVMKDAVYEKAEAAGKKRC